MISSGEEGYKADGDISAPHNNWINGGYKGVDFRGNIQNSGVDYTQIHAYPDNWGFTPDNYKSWYGPNFIKDRANIAFSYNKPIIVEEYGLALGRVERCIERLCDGLCQQMGSRFRVCWLFGLGGKGR